MLPDLVLLQFLKFFQDILCLALFRPFLLFCRYIHQALYVRKADFI